MTKAIWRLELPYHRKGDDLAYCLTEAEEDDKRALLLHAQLMLDSATLLQRCASLAVDGDLKVTTADGHWIEVEVEEDRVKDLIDLGALVAPIPTNFEDVDDDHLDGDPPQDDPDDDDPPDDTPLFDFDKYEKADWLNWTPSIDDDDEPDILEDGFREWPDGFWDSEPHGNGDSD